jgi:hypothetical protein
MYKHKEDIMMTLKLNKASAGPFRGWVEGLSTYPDDRINQLSAAAVEAICWENNRRDAADTLRQIADEIEHGQ